LSARKLEERVRDWNFAHGDEREPDLDDHYGMRLSNGFMDGYGQLILEGPNDMLARVVALADAYGNFLFHNQPTQLRLDRIDDESRDETPGTRDKEPPRPTSAKRLDWFLDLCEEIALVNQDKIDPELASIGITLAYEDLINNARTLLPTDQGVVVTGEAARRLACDAGIHRFVTARASELLDIGRKSRTWTTAQRRAIRALWNYRCPFPGCNRRIGAIHHCQHWTADGPTGIANGIPPCSYHHHLLHEGGWTGAWTARGTVIFTGPDGQTIEATPPGLRRAVA
jgi:hypothetical protein